MTTQYIILAVLVILFVALIVVWMKWQKRASDLLKILVEVSTVISAIGLILMLLIPPEDRPGFSPTATQPSMVEAQMATPVSVTFAPTVLPATSTVTPTDPPTAAPAFTLTPTRTALAKVKVASPTLSTGFTMLLENVTAVRPTSEERTTVHSIWNYPMVDIDLKTPRAVSYMKDFQPTEKRMMVYEWCTLEQNRLSGDVPHITVSFWIDGAELDTDYIIEFDKHDTPQWYCHRWATRLQDWTPGSRVNLQVRYAFDQPLWDGEYTYPAGTYQVGLNVRVSE